MRVFIYLLQGVQHCLQRLYSVLQLQQASFIHPYFCVRTCDVPEYSCDLLTGKFYCLWFKFAFDFLVAFRFVGLYTHCYCFHANYLFFLFIFLHVWKEFNYIPFDSADGKYILVLGLKTLSFRHEEITDKSCTWKQIFRMTVAAWTFYRDKTKCACWFKICLWDTDGIFVPYEVKMK